MSIESESFLEEARKAFAAAHRPPMSERFDAVMQAFEVSCRCREQFALRMKAALESNDPDVIKEVAQQWVKYELFLVPPLH